MDTSCSASPLRTGRDRFMPWNKEEHAKYWDRARLHSRVLQKCFHTASSGPLSVELFGKFVVGLASGT